MLKNYLKIALRNLWRHRAYSSINILGLACGLACCTFLVLYVQHEQSYDRFHKDADRIYRLVDGMRFDQAFPPSAITPSAWAPVIAEEMPEVVEAARIRNLSRFNPLVRYQDKRFQETRLIEADPTLLQVFDFELVSGDPTTALARPGTVVITETMARKYFGDADPLGRLLTFGDEGDYEVTGVLENIPPTSSFTFDFVLPLLPSDSNRVWTHSFLKLQEGASPTEFEARLAPFVRARWGGAPYAPRQAMTPRLQPLTDIHLHSSLQFEFGPNSDVLYVYILSSIAVLILLVACINFMNLATARSATRAREVGLRKVMGAQRGQLIKQFLGESVILTSIALLLALVLVQLFLPTFNDLSGKTLVIDYTTSRQFLLWLVGGALFVGLVAGSYPAFYLSGFQPVGMLKGGPTGGSGRKHRTARLRRGLVVVQFVATLVMMIGTGVVYDQLVFMQNADLGFRQEQVVVIHAHSRDLKAGAETFKRELVQNPDIMGASFAQSLPGRSESMASLVYRVEGQEETQVIRTFAVDHDFIEVLGIEMAEGRGFSNTFATDSSAFILNEAAVQAFGWTDPLGKRMEEVNQGWQGNVIGVVKDFHFASLQQQIEPVVFHIVPATWFNLVAVHVQAENLASTMQFLEAHWRRNAPDETFEYTFLDNTFDSLYRAEERLQRVFVTFAVLALFVACLGLFALASFTAQQRTKEIGVRKVLGASVPDIVLLLSKDFIVLVAIAFAVASPLAYLFMVRWLENFAYRVDIGLEGFALSGLLTVLVAWLTVSYQSIRAALIDPVKTLRHS